MVKIKLIKGDIYSRDYLDLLNDPSARVIWKAGFVFSKESQIRYSENSKDTLNVNTPFRVRCFTAKDLNCLLNNEEITFYAYLTVRPVIYLDPKTVPDYILGSDELVQSVIGEIMGELVTAFSGTENEYREIIDINNFSVIELKDFPKSIKKTPYYNYNRNWSVEYGLIYKGVPYDTDYWKANDSYYKIAYQGKDYLFHHHRTESSQNWSMMYSYETKIEATYLETHDLLEILKYYLWIQKKSLKN